MVHWLLSTGTSTGLGTWKRPPEPSHTVMTQSPAVWALTGVPATVNETPHKPAVQVRTPHSVSCPGQSAAVVHCPQMLLLQEPPWQSAPPLHGFPAAQG